MGRRMKDAARPFLWKTPQIRRHFPRAIVSLSVLLLQVSRASHSCLAAGVHPAAVLREVNVLEAAGHTEKFSIEYPGV